jgi:hypothetical protein
LMLCSCGVVVLLLVTVSLCSSQSSTRCDCLESMPAEVPPMLVD